jgi:hypothetical protein
VSRSVDDRAEQSSIHVDLRMRYQAQYTPENGALARSIIVFRTALPRPDLGVRGKIT